MPLLLWRLLTLLLVALSMALSFCHLMEMPVRLSWEPSLWMQTTNFGGLYYLFGRVGAAIDVSAIVAAAVLAVLTRHRRPAFQLTIAGALLMAAGLAVWFGFVAPMNAIMAGWTPDTVPSDFIEVRNQWEYSHAAIAAIKIAGLAALLLSVLVDTAGRPSPTRPPGLSREEVSVNQAALFIKHKTLPGKRDEVRRIWEKHLKPRIAENAAHQAYFYCYDDTDPDTICVFQLYGDRSAPQAFVKASWYAAYEKEVSPLLTGQSEFRAATPHWIKG